MTLFVQLAPDVSIDATNVKSVRIRATCQEDCVIGEMTQTKIRKQFYEMDLFVPQNVTLNVAFSCQCNAASQDLMQAVRSKSYLFQNFSFDSGICSLDSKLTINLRVDTCSFDTFHAFVHENNLGKFAEYVAEWLAVHVCYSSVPPAMAKFVVTFLKKIRRYLNPFWQKFAHFFWYIYEDFEKAPVNSLVTLNLLLFSLENGDGRHVYRGRNICHLVEKLVESQQLIDVKQQPEAVGELNTLFQHDPNVMLGLFRSHKPDFSIVLFYKWYHKSLPLGDILGFVNKTNLALSNDINGISFVLKDLVRCDNSNMTSAKSLFEVIVQQM